MPGVWAKDGSDRWRPLTATGFVSEADLHNLIEQTPAMLPLAGTPTLAIIGREVNCGRERADLLAIEVDTGRPVIIEVKLATNTDRRQALTQVLGYAAYLRRLDPDGLNSILHVYLTQHGYASTDGTTAANPSSGPRPPTRSSPAPPGVKTLPKRDTSFKVTPLVQPQSNGVALPPVQLSGSKSR